MVPTEQMLHWIEQCEQAAKENDLAKLAKPIPRINAAVDTEVAGRHGKSVDVPLSSPQQ
jgi:hypothetical protein